MLLTLWCKEGVGQTFDAYPGATKVIHKYQKYDNLVCDLTGEMDDILAELGYTDASDMDNNGGYIRWSAINADGVNAGNLGTNVYNAPSGTITLFYGGSAEWWAGTYTKMTSDAYYWYNGVSSFQENGSKYLNVSLNFAWGETMQTTFPEYTISCYIANEPFNTSTNAEPQIDIQYVFHFNETGESSVDPFENVESISKSFTPSIEISEVSSPSDITINLTEFNNETTAPSYIRWYFADASGNAVANPGFNLTNGSYTYTSQGNSIYYGGTTIDTDGGLLNMTVTPQNGKSWSDLTSYKLVALLSNEVGTTGTDGTLTQEPLIATKYEISFEIVSFEGSTTGAKSLSETIRLVDDAMSSVTLSLPLSSVQGYMANEASSFYIRYYLTDKSGNRVALPVGVTITPTDNNITLTSNDYGHYWYSSTGIIGSITDLGVTVADGNDAVDLRNYNVVAVMSSNAPLQVETDGTVTYEPREMEVVYTYELKKPVDNSFDGACIGVTKYVPPIDISGIDIQSKPITLTELFTDYGKDENKGVLRELFSETPKYVRVYIRKKRGQELLSNQGDWFSCASGNQHNVNENFYLETELGRFWTYQNLVSLDNNNGYVWPYTGFNSYACEAILRVDVKQPDNTVNLIDCEVVMVLSSKEEREYDYTSTPKTITKGPESHEVEYIFRFTDGVDRFSGSLKDGVEPVNQSILVNSGTTSYTLTYDDCETLKSALGSSNPAYIRWYLVDADGNKMNETQSWITCPNGYVEGLELNQGYYWYDGTYIDELLGVKITVPAGYSIFDYQLVAVASKEPVADENIEDGTVITEPDWDAQCYFKFEEKFRGTLSDEASKKKYTMVLPTTHWDGYAEYKILFDKDNNQLLLQDEENTVLYKVDDPFTELANLSVDYANGPFYIRWFLRDKTTGEETYIEGSLGNYSTNSDDAIFVDGGKKGLYWTSQLQSEQNIASSLRITVDRTPDGGSAFNMTDYELVMHVSNQEIPAGYLNTDGGVLYHEPDELQLEYSIQFVNKPFLSADTAFEEERKRYAYYDNETGKIAINFNKEERANIVDYFNTSNALPFGTNYYIRWSLEDKEGNVIPLTNSEDECLVVSANNTSKYITNDIGLYMYSKWVNYTHIPDQELTMTVTPPAGMLYTDLRIVFAITTNLEGIDEKIENGFVTDIYSEPNNIQLRYVYTPIIENEVPFVHYKGVTGRDWEVVQSNPYVDKFNNQAYDASNDVEYVETGDVRQGTHEWTYEMYAPLSTDDVTSYKTFVLPIMKVDDGGDSYEPRAYFRWYDWDTDFSSKALSSYDSDKTKLKEWFFQTVGNEKKSRGLFAWNLTENAVASNVAAVNYLMPKDTDWEGDTIACEISKFLDGWNEAADLIEHEPTLLYRYKYIIRPASVIADKIVAGVKGGNRALYEEELLENHGNVTLAVAPTGESYNPYKGTTTLRLNLSDVNNYYFYPYDAVKKTWDKTNNKIYEATSITWVMYDASGNKLKDLTPMDDNTFCKVTYTNNGPKIGELFYVIAFAANGSYSAPIAKFNCKFVDNSHPILFDAGSNGEAIPDFRTIDYLEENYTRVALISFDVEEGATLTSPTDQIDNANPYPFAWKRSHYGYCYPQLYNALTSNAAQYVGLGALHGDYRLVKKAWEAGASYVELWHAGRGLLDRTHQLTDGLQSGYFLYIDASDESRPIANVQFEGDMCVGSTVVLSAAVADMTSAQTHPQLMFKLYGIHLDADGNETERKLIHSFATADFSTLGCGAVGQWYQTYAKITLRGNSGVENYQNFLVSIDNYCDGTLGADYAIDDIRIYVQNSKVEVKQNTIPCGEDPINFDFRVRYETLSGFLSTDPNDFPQPICFRICDEEGNAVTGDYDNGTNTNYGVVFAPYTFDEASDYCETDASGNQYFVFTGKSGMLLDLDPEKKYYVSVAIPQDYTKEETVVDVETIVDGETIVTQKTVTTYTCTFASDDVWGNPSKICSMYSRVFQPLKQYMKLSVGGSVISSINISCGKRNTDEAFGANKYSIAGQLQIPDKSTGGFITVNDTELCPFDWYVEIKGGDADLEFTTALKDALRRFRTVYPTATSLQEANGVFTTDDYNLLDLAITRGAPNNTNGKLYLYNGTNVLVGPNYVVGNTYIITAIPIKENIVYQEKPYEVCPEPMEVTVEARLNGPELKLGFNDVLYPSKLPQGANVLRVGLAQLKNMRENGVPLHLPVYGYKDMNKGQENPLLLDEFGLMLVDTNDPTWDDYLNTDMWVDAYRLATGLKPNENLHEITAENNSVELYFHKNWHTVKELEWWNNSWVNTVDTKRPIEFHEGYWYEVSFRYIDQTEYVSKSPSKRCYGEAYFTIKIVPEYVTWGEGLPNNSNWLNDENWSRSNVEELYKTTTNSDDYKNNAEIDERLEDKGFVPMKFSKVTILGGISTPYPYLYNLEEDYHSGILKRTTNGDNSVATTDIEYDMMVKIEPEYCPNETDEANKVEVYECEKFYGNECEQIYFKPGAQLRYQHYLAYNRAWVDFELETDQWYMLTSPLSNLYAGDMFVPAKSSLDYFGRQETEAFQEIAFKGLADDGIYSRTKYPIYQRSWDRVSSLVVTPKDDQRAPEYDAFIDYTDEDWANSEMNVVFSQWSHVYNELDEEYIPGMGFSIKAHKEKQTEKALIRLPKNDTEYTYYSYDDKPGEIKASLSNRVDDAQYKLATKDIVTGIFTVNPHDHDGECDYYQVGNPYMASMNMDLFFNQNMHLERKYWTIVSGVLHTVDGSGSMGYVGPMQSFFVKAIDGGVVESVTFSPYMTVSSNAVNTVSEGESGQMLSFTTRATANVPMAQTRVVLSAEADNGFVDEEDVETLLDSNLEDVPMVYTVAGTQAAMVNRLNDVTLLPLGLFGAEGETVDVQVHGVDRFSQTLYFYDASTGKQTALEEGTALSLEANVHGRYFLTTRALEDDAVTDDTDWQVRAYSLQRGELIVASMPQDNLRQVRIYGVNGHQVVNDATAQGHVATYALPSGIYVAEVVTERLSRPQVVKVVVR